MFPVRIEQQYISATERWFNGVSKLIIEDIFKEIKSDNTFSTDSIGDIYNRISSAIEKHSGYGRKLFRSAYTRVYFAIDKRVKRETEKAAWGIGLQIDLPDEVANVILLNRVALNDSMWSELFNYFKKDLVETVRTAFGEGWSQSKIIDEIINRTGVIRSKAKFWASDQTGLAFGEMQKHRQTQVGFPGYIWRTKRDGRVRDSHIHLEGKYFPWSSGAQADGKWLHPGYDNNCRCHPEPAFDESEADSQDVIQNSLNQINKKRLTMGKTRI